MDNQPYSAKIAQEGSILVLFLVDTAVRKHIKAFDPLSSHEDLSLMDSRTVLLLLMTADLLIFILVPGYGQRPCVPLAC